MSKAAATIFCILAVYLAFNLHVYGLGGAFNHGAYAQAWPSKHFCGFEWQGVIGGFCDVDY